MFFLPSVKKPGFLVVLDSDWRKRNRCRSEELARFALLLGVWTGAAAVEVGVSCAMIGDGLIPVITADKVDEATGG